MSQILPELPQRWAPAGPDVKGICIAARSNRSEGCALCGNTADVVAGGLQLAIVSGPETLAVCRECGDEHAPEAVAALDAYLSDLFQNNRKCAYPCPICGGESVLVNPAPKEDWGVCEACKVRWSIGWGLTSGWKYMMSEDDFRKARELLEQYADATTQLRERHKSCGTSSPDDHVPAGCYEIPF